MEKDKCPEAKSRQNNLRKAVKKQAKLRSCTAYAMGQYMSRELGWRLKNTRTQTDRNAEAWVILETRMPTLLCSREAYIGILN